MGDSTLFMRKLSRSKTSFSANPNESSLKYTPRASNKGSIDTRISDSLLSGPSLHSPAQTVELCVTEVEGKTVLKGSTLVSLVEKLTGNTFAETFAFDPNFLASFLLLHNSFTTGKNLLEILENRFNSVGSSKGEETNLLNPICLRVINVVKRWLRTHPSDFEDEKLREKLYKFIELVGFVGMRAPAESLLELANELRMTTTEKSQTEAPVISPHSVESLASLQLNDFSVGDWVKAICLTESALFQKIKPRDYCKLLRQSNKNNHSFQEISAFMEHNELLQAWTTYQILRSNDKAQAIEYFISISSELISQKNLNAAYLIITTLQSNQISKLKSAWDSVSKDAKKVFLDLELFVKNFKKLNEELSAGPPCVPFLPLYIEQMERVEVSQSDFLRENVINVEKYSEIGKMINKLENLASSKYTMDCPSTLSVYFSNLKQLVHFAHLAAIKNVEKVDDKKQHISKRAELKKGMMQLLNEDAEFREYLKSIIWSDVKMLVDKSVAEKITQLEDQRRKREDTDKEGENEKEEPDREEDKAFMMKAECLLRSRFPSPDWQVKVWTKMDDDGEVYGWPDKITLHVVKSLQSSVVYMVDLIPFLDDYSMAIYLKKVKFFKRKSKNPDSNFGKKLVVAKKLFDERDLPDVIKSKAIEIELIT